MGEARKRALNAAAAALAIAAAAAAAGAASAAETITYSYDTDGLGITENAGRMAESLNRVSLEPEPECDKCATPQLRDVLMAADMGSGNETLAEVIGGKC